MLNIFAIKSPFKYLLRKGLDSKESVIKKILTQDEIKLQWIYIYIELKNCFKDN